jgi:hypothetical protein
MTLVTTLDKKSLESVMKVIEDLGKNARQQIRIAINKTGDKVKTASARKLRKELNAPVKVLKKAIRIEKQTNTDWLAATVLMIAGHKIPLKYFGARQTKSGTAFKVNSSNKGKLPHAFVIPKYEKRVYQRVGKQRGPLAQQRGPAPGEVYQSSGVVSEALRVANEELPKQINERVRFLTLQAQGKLKGNQR